MSKQTPICPDCQIDMSWAAGLWYCKKCNTTLQPHHFFDGSPNPNYTGQFQRNEGVSLVPENLKPYDPRRTAQAIPKRQ